MGALIVAAAVTLLGAVVGWTAAQRLGPASGVTPRQRLARISVLLLGAVAGGEITSQLYTLVHRLQLDAKLDGGFGGQILHEDNLLDVTYAIRAILFHGVLLIGLATAVALIAERGADRAGA